MVMQYNFSRGHPHPSLLPTREIKELMLSMAKEDSKNLQECLNYGQDEGAIAVRQSLAAFLGRQCEEDEGGGGNKAQAIDVNRLFVTHGVSHGIELLTAVATQPGDVVWVECPTYFLVAGLFRAHGLQIETLPMHANGSGVNVNKLTQELKSGIRKPPRLVYVIPTHQNPTGRTMTVEDRQALTDLAHQYQFLLLADEAYHLLDWRNPPVDGPRPARMATFEASLAPRTDASKLFGCCSISSFTKIFGPGVRCGWIEGPIPVVQAVAQYGYIQSQGGVAPFVGEMMKRAMDSRAVDRVLENLCAAYQGRCSLLAAILSTSRHIEMTMIPVGGYFLWIQFPVAAADMLKAVSPEVTFLLGSQCQASVQDEESSSVQLERCARLCFADLGVDDLRAGAQLLVVRVQAYMESLEPMAAATALNVVELASVPSDEALELEPPSLKVFVPEPTPQIAPAQEPVEPEAPVVSSAVAPSVEVEEAVPTSTNVAQVDTQDETVKDMPAPVEKTAVDVVPEESIESEPVTPSVTPIAQEPVSQAPPDAPVVPLAPKLAPLTVAPSVQEPVPQAPAPSPAVPPAPALAPPPKPAATAVVAPPGVEVATPIGQDFQWAYELWHRKGLMAVVPKHT